MTSRPAPDAPISPVSQNRSATSGPPGVGGRAVTGVAWLASDAAGSKVVSIVTQLVLAQLLAPEAFGLFALALTVVTFAEMAQMTGARDILIRRKAEYETYAPVAVWMCGLIGVLGAAGVAAAAPFAARMYDAPELRGVLWIAAAAVPFTALTPVARSRLESSFRYRPIALTRWAVLFGRSVASVAMAALGMGVYALIIPLAAGGIVQFLIFASLAGLPLRLDPGFRLWRVLARDMAFLLAVGLVSAGIAQGDYFALGLFADEATVGVYYVAFTLSLQAIVLLSTNTAAVLMPALNELNVDRERQCRAFLGAVRGLALVVTPVCLIQAALAEPFVRLVLRPEYAAAALPMAILCVGMTFRAISIASPSLLKAQGRFGRLLVLHASLAVPFLSLAMLGAYFGGLLGVAIGVSVGCVITGLAFPTLALDRGLTGLGEMARVQIPPFLIGVCAAGAAWLAALPVPGEGRAGAAAQLVLGTSVGCCVYAALARVVLPAASAEVLNRTEKLWLRVPPLRGLIVALGPPGLRARGFTGGMPEGAVA